MKIRTKLLTIFITISFIPLILVQFVTFQNAKSELEKSIINQLNVIADLKVDKLETWFSERRIDMISAQDYFNIKNNLPIVTKYINDKTNFEYIQAKNTLDSQLQTFQKSNEYADVMLTNMSGEIVYVSNPKHTLKDLGVILNNKAKNAFTEGKKDIYFSDIFFDDYDKKFFMLITAPVRDEFSDNIIGVIIFEVDMSSIYGFIQDTTGLGETGETLLGVKMISHPGEMESYEHSTGIIGDHVLFLNPLRNDPDAALKRSVYYDDPSAIPIQEATQGKNGSGVSIDYRNESVLAAWRYVPSKQWGLVSKIDTAEAFAPINNVRDVLIIVGILMFVFILLLAFYMSGNITTPIINLTKNAQLISEGKFDIQLPVVKSKDEIFELTRTFNKMSQSLQKSDKEKYEFITSASHQLRTPSSGVKLQLVELEQELKKITKNTKLLNSIKDLKINNSRIVVMTNDLFKILELGDIYTATKLKKINLKKLISMITESFDEDITKNKLNIKINISAPLEIYAEERRIKDALINLVENAVSYSNKGGKIRIDARRTNGDILCKITNTGIGIPKSEQINVFDKFFRAKNVYLKKGVGTGLGLVIAKTIIEGHNGKIWFKSVENKETTFYFTLPRNIS